MSTEGRSTPAIFVGLVTHNSLGDLPTAISSLNAQTYSNITVYVFDNQSTDDTLNWLLSVPSLRGSVIESRDNIGFGAAHNQIIRQLQWGPGDMYAAVNPDIVLAPDYLQILRKVITENNAGWATGRLIMQDANDDEENRHILYSLGHGLLRSGFAFNIGYGLPEIPNGLEAREIFGAPGAAVVYTHEFVVDLSTNGHFFDPSFFLYYEDVDVDWRGRLRGWSCYLAPSAEATHIGSHPDEHLKTEALANRFTSFFKNSFIQELLLFSPLIFAHMFARILLSPAQGARLLVLLVLRIPRIGRTRTIPSVSREDMLEWFSWSSRQPSAQPVSLTERVSAYFGRRFRKR